MIQKLRFLCVTAAVALLLVIQAAAAPEIDIGTNGSNASFAPDSIIVISGQLTDGGTPLSDNPVKVTVKNPDASVFVQAR